MWHGVGIESIMIGSTRVPVRETQALSRPFCRLLRLERQQARDDPKVLVVAPLSGHFAVMLRDMLVGLLPAHDVYVTEWIDARLVPVEAGPFGFDDNIAYLLDFIRMLGSGAHLIGLCQSVVPVLAATALLADDDDANQPASVTLIAGPVDARINPSRVDRLLKERSLGWFKRSVIATVPEGHPGVGRRVYPRQMQLSGLMMYLARHLSSGGELLEKLTADDGDDPARFPFRSLYTAVMDLSAEIFLDQVRLVFQDFTLAQGRLAWRGRRVDPRAIRRTALTTIEAELDDIAPPGQTRSAHALCENVPNDARRHLLQPAIGHFGTFHGRVWRAVIMPFIAAALRASR